MLLAAPTARATADRPDVIRLGFTFSMFTAVNENDAKASIKALTSVIAQERGIPADPDPLLVADAAGAKAALTEGRVDALAMTTEEYWPMRDSAQVDRFLFGSSEGEPAEEYVLLTHRAASLPDLPSLRGMRLAIYLNPRMSLARTWLEVELAESGLPPLRDFVRRISESTKLQRPILDVFFRRTDACLVHRRGLAMMVEMNPQVGAELHVVAVSPRLVPAMFGFRTGIPTAVKEKCLREFVQVHTSASGQQAMTIFQIGEIAERPVSALDSAFALLARHDSLRARSSHAHAVPASALKP